MTIALRWPARRCHSICWLLCLALLLGGRSAAWEAAGQPLPTTRAIEALPEPLQSFFEAHREQILALASDPGQWNATDRKLAHHGYVRLDAYGEFPYAQLPRDYDAAVAKFSRKKVTARGTLPWQIGLYSLRLQQAFQVGDKEAIIRSAAILAHYVAEAHDPFNTTRNFDGSRSGQPGVDARYSGGLVERYQMFFLIRPAPAFKITDPTDYAFGIVLEAHSWLENILLCDSLARADQPDYTDAYYDAFYEQVGPILIRQLTRASQNIASYWYTAWLNAASPLLPR